MHERGFEIPETTYGQTDFDRFPQGFFAGARRMVESIRGDRDLLRAYVTYREVLGTRNLAMSSAATLEAELNDGVPTNQRALDFRSWVEQTARCNRSLRETTEGIRDYRFREFPGLEERYVEVERMAGEAMEPWIGSEPNVTIHTIINGYWALVELVNHNLRDELESFHPYSED